MSEDSALRSFDLVYFLLVPTMFFAVQYLRQTQAPLGPVESTMLALIFPGALVSLPFGVHATISGSVGGRIRAWAILTFLSGFYFGQAIILYPVSFVLPQFFPLVIEFPTPIVLSLAFGLGGYLLGGVGIGSSWWMRWIYQTFLRRLPSKRSEIEVALDYRILRVFVRPYVDGDWKMTRFYLGLGLILYLVFFILYWLQSIGWNLP